MGFRVKLQRFRAVFAVFDWGTDRHHNRAGIQHIPVRRLAAGKLLLKQNLGQRGKSFCQPVQPAAERLIAGQLLELAQMVCSDEIVDTLPRQ